MLPKSLLLYIMTIGFSLVFTICYGNYSYFPADHYLPVTHYNKESGHLSQNQVQSIAEDHQGFLWIGTVDGLFRYDGINFIDYKQLVRGNKLSGHNISHILVDKSGNLWISTTYNGINHFNLTTNTITQHKNIFPINTTSNDSRSLLMIEDDYNNFWIGTRNGLIKYNKTTGHSTYFHHDANNDNSLYHHFIHSLAYDAPDTLWVGTEGGLQKITIPTNEVTRIDAKILLQLKHFSSYRMHLDNQQRLWVSSGVDLYQFHNNKLTLYRFNHLLASTTIRALTADKNHQLWLATDTEVIAISLNTQQITKRIPITSNLQKNNFTSTLLVRDDNTLWYGTKFSGLHKINLAGFQFQHMNSQLGQLPDNRIISIFEDTRETLWISTHGKNLNGYHYKTNSWKHLSATDLGLTDQGTYVNSITGDNNNSLWLATQAGLIQYNTETSKTKLITAIDSGNQIDNGNQIISFKDSLLVCFLDSQSRLWISAGSGSTYYVQLPEMKAGIINPQHTLSDKISLLFFEDHAKTIWVGTDLGIYYYDEISRDFIALPLVSNGEKISSPIRSFAETEPGILWIGTEHGLLNYDKNTNSLSHYTIEDGLSHNAIAGILPGKKDFLWLSTYNGLNRFNYKTKTNQTFNKSDGLLDNEFDAYASFKARNGYLYFAGPAGSVYFHPDNIHIPSLNANIVFTDFKIIGQQVRNMETPANKYQPISYNESIILNHRENDFSLHFAALDFNDPLGINYYYKLEYYDQYWRKANHKNLSLHYANLSADNYNLHIKARDHQGRWFKNQAHLEIQILPPPWKTWWAYTLYILCSTLLLFMIHSYRTRQLRNRAKTLSIAVEERTQDLVEKNLIIEDLLQTKDKIFANISHELRTPLTLIISPVKQLIQQYREKSAPRDLHIILRNAYRLLRMVEQLLDLSYLQQNKEETSHSRQYIWIDIDELIKSNINAFQLIAKEKNIHLELIKSCKAYVYSIQDDIEKILLNLLSNAIKYTLENGTVKVELNLESQSAIIKITDSGIGIPQDQLSSIFHRFSRVDNDHKIPGAGIGLALVKELVEKLSGSITATSELGSGSTFTLVLPAQQQAPHSADINLQMDHDIHSSIETLSIEMSEYVDSQQASTKVLADSDVKQLLIIEDNKDLQQHLKQSFMDEYHCLTADDGRQGIQLARDNIPDIIISDIMLPGADGFQVCQTIKEQDLTCHIPIILLTAIHDRDSRLQGLKQKADDYLTKPFDITELRIRIENLLSIRQMLMQRLNQQAITNSQGSGRQITDHIENEKDKLLIEKLNLILEKNYHKADLNILDLASAMAMSDRQLQRKIKAITGQKPVEYLRVFRMEKSIIHLQKGSNIETVAYHSGFSSSSYYSKCFKAHFGISPTSYNPGQKSHNVAIELKTE